MHEGNYINNPGGPVVKVPHLYCRGCRFNPWSRNLRPHMMLSAAKKKKKKREMRN